MIREFYKNRCPNLIVPRFFLVLASIVVVDPFSESKGIVQRLFLLLPLVFFLVLLQLFVKLLGVLDKDPSAFAKWGFCICQKNAGKDDCQDSESDDDHEKNDLEDGEIAGHWVDGEQASLDENVSSVELVFRWEKLDWRIICVGAHFSVCCQLSGHKWLCCFPEIEGSSNKIELVQFQYKKLIQQIKKI